VPSRIVSGLSLLPAYAVQRPVCIHPLCASWSQRLSRTVSGRRLDRAPPRGSLLLRPRGPRSGPGYSVPVRHHLIGPHPPHSRAHRDFAAWRLIRDAIAVRERLGDPRVVPRFRCTFRPDMPSSLTSGSSIIVSVQKHRCRRWPSLWTKELGTPNSPAIRFTRGTVFAATLVRNCYGLSGCWSPLYGSDRSPSHRGLLLPGFRQVGRPSRRWI
jgi:hypothetical protein